MPGDAARADVSLDGAERLLALALARPGEALRKARAVLDQRPAPALASVAHQTVGLVLRDRGELAAARRELRLALQLAERTGDPTRVADVRASLAVALSFSGRTAAALAMFDAAVAGSSGSTRARVLVRRAAVLHLLGRPDEALPDLSVAVAALREYGDGLWEARALLNRSMLHLEVGVVAAARHDIARAVRLFTETGQDLEAAKAVQNGGIAAYLAGHLPAALQQLAVAEQRYRELDVVLPELAQERCGVLLAAGLAREAFSEVETALARTVSPAFRAELLLAAAAAALACGDARHARQRATQASRMFRQQRRERGAARAGYLRVQACYAAGERSGRLRRAAEDVVAALAACRAEEVALAHLLAGRLAMERDPTAAAAQLARAAAYRRRGSPLPRATGWLAEALRRQTAGGRGVPAACGRGLDALDEHLLTLGASDLRALATGHGRELAAIALRHAARHGDARALMRWSERWRATALTAPPVHPPDDAELARELAALRDVVRRLERARADGRPTAALERDRARCEQAVRRRRHVTTGPGGRAARFDLEELLAGLGDTALVELVAVDGVLLALVAHQGVVRRRVVGPVDAAVREVDFARVALRRWAYRGTGNLSGVGDRLQAALLGAAASHLGDGPVVVVPPGRLHTAPWGLLPALTDLPSAVVPSAALWLRARRATPDSDRVLIAVGPELGSGGAEVGPVAACYPHARRLGGGTATVEQVLAGLDGARLAHLAAHGDFRADSPLLSCLRLDDGPLTVHDLERLRRPPYRLVLSACDSAVAEPVGGDELLGLVSGLLALGTAGVLASVVPVHDAATVPVMCAVHEALRDGADLAGAALMARRRCRDDPLTGATAASYVAIGV